MRPGDFSPKLSLKPKWFSRPAGTAVLCWTTWLNLSMASQERERPWHLSWHLLSPSAGQGGRDKLCFPTGEHKGNAPSVRAHSPSGAMVDDETRQARPCVMGGGELKGKDAWIRPAGLSSPPWIYHPALMRGSRRCVMRTSPGSARRVCHVLAKMLQLSSCPQKLSG